MSKCRRIGIVCRQREGKASTEVKEEEEEAAEEVTSFSDRPSRRGKIGHRRFPSA